MGTKHLHIRQYNLRLPLLCSNLGSIGSFSSWSKLTRTSIPCLASHKVYSTADIHVFQTQPWHCRTLPSVNSYLMPRICATLPLIILPAFRIVFLQQFMLLHWNITLTRVGNYRSALYCAATIFFSKFWISCGISGHKVKFCR